MDNITDAKELMKDDEPHICPACRGDGQEIEGCACDTCGGIGEL